MALRYIYAKNVDDLALGESLPFSFKRPDIIGFDRDKSGLSDAEIDLALAKKDGRIVSELPDIVDAFSIGAGVFELSSLDGANGFYVNGLGSGERLGYAVASAGDINDDGLMDVIIGAPGAGPNSEGMAYIVFGSVSGTGLANFDLTTLNGSNGFSVSGINSFSDFGAAVSSLGDVNGDGIDDLIIGAHAEDVSVVSSVGAAYVIFGSNTTFLPNIDLFTLNGTNGFSITVDPIDSSHLGTSVADAGDVNGDGVNDIIVGASGDFSTGVNGAAYVVFGTVTGFGASINVSNLNGGDGYLLTTGQVDQLGTSVSGIGDFNGDGIDDLLVSAPDGGALSEGLSYVVFGQLGGSTATRDLTALNGIDGVRIDGAAASHSSGHSVSGAGDINNDGIADLIISSVQAEPNGPNSGEIYVVFGQNTTFAPTLALNALSGTNGFEIAGLNTFDEAGFSVASAGDFNGDGFDDIVISAPNSTYAGNANAGLTFVIFGTDTGFAAQFDLNAIDGSNGLVLAGINANDYSGRSVSGAGDVNGDGFDDLIIGANRAAPNGSDSGQAYIVYGFANPPVNTAPKAEHDDVITSENAVFSGNVLVDNGNGADSDADGDVLSVFEVNGVTGLVGETLAGDNGGVFVVNANGTFSFDPGTDFDALAVGETQTTEITYSIDDGNGSADTATVSVQVNGQNDAPFGYDPSVGNGVPVDPNNYIPMQSELDGANVTDLDLSTYFKDVDGSDTLTISVAIADLPPGMSYNAATQSITGTPSASASQGGPLSDGVYTALVTVSDGNGGTFTTNVRYTIINTIPVAQSDVLDVRSAEAVVNIFDDHGAGADTDADGDTLSISMINGNLVSQGDSIVLSSGLTVRVFGGGEIGFFGPGLALGDTVSDSFNYTVSDGEGGTDTVSVSIDFLNNSVFVDAPDGAFTTTLEGANSGDRLGASVASVGDLNDDGYDDLIIGAPDASVNGTGSGQSYVVFGSSTGVGVNVDVSALDGTNGFALNGVAGADYSGISVASAGDVNGDGIDDLLIGASGANANGDVDNGVSYVVFGHNSTVAPFPAIFELSALDGTNGFVINGVGGGDASGYRVSRAGDINGDGIGDILIGAPESDVNDTDSGTSYVVFGSSAGFAASVDLANLNGTDGFALHGVFTNDQSGISVSAVGDINGDGIDDFVIGANNASGGGGQSGASYVVFGATTAFPANFDLSSLLAANGGDGSLGFVVEGSNASDQSGISVSSAGDFNGDGFADILIGANGASPNGADSGQSYVVFGTDTGFTASLELSTLDGTNGFSINGVQAFDQSGFSLSSAGDFNGDGYDDILIGAYEADSNGVILSGKSYLIFGAASGFSADFDLADLDGVNGFIIHGKDVEDNSGVSVSGAGDLNGDGFDDILVGAPNANGSAGEVYVIYGSGANRPPQANDDDFTTDQDIAIAGDVFADNGNGEDIDLDGDLLSVIEIDGSISSVGSSVTGDNGGVFTVQSDGSYSFDPDGDFNGLLGGQSLITQIQYTVSDGNGGTATAIVSVVVNGLGSGPIARNDNFVTASDVNLTGNILADNGNGADSDPDGDALNVNAVNGSVSAVGTSVSGDDGGLFTIQSDGSYSFDPDGNFDELLGNQTRTTSVSYEISDGNGGADTAIVSVVVSGVNAAPIANDDDFATDPQTGLSGSVLDDNGHGVDSDPENTPLIVVEIGGATSDVGIAVSGDSGGLFTINANGSYSFDPAGSFDDLGAGVSRTTTIEYTIADENGDTDIATVTVVVTGQNSGPTAQDDVFNTDTEAHFVGDVFADNGNGNDTDADGDTLNVSAVNGESLNVGEAVAGSDGGVFVVLADGRLSFDPGADFTDLVAGESQTTYISYTVSDGNGGMDTATIGITVTAPETVEAQDDLISGNPETSLFDLLADNGNGADIDTSNGALHITHIDGQAVSNGDVVVLGSGLSVTFLGDGDIELGADVAGFYTDSFSYTVTNGDGLSDTGFVTAEFSLSTLDVTALDGTNGFRFSGGSSADETGFSVSSAGDFNNDGFDDILIGAHFANPNGNDDAGQTFLVYGSATGFASDLDLSALDGTDGFVLNGIAAFDNSGWAVSEAGDINGDGIDDILIGAQLADPNRVAQSGQTYVVFGTESGLGANFDLASLNGANGFAINGIDFNDQSGLSISSAGDVNGDGVDDLLIGARAADPNGVNLSGESYVVFGRASGFAATLELASLNGTNGFTLNGVGDRDQSGFSVSAAGDVNGDGIDDILIGAYLSDVNGDDSGQAYVVFGHTGGFNTALDLASLNAGDGFTINGLAQDDQLGVSVSEAGDVNGDGIDDIIVGARFADTNTDDNGASYVIFGDDSGFGANFDLYTLDGTNGFAIIGAAQDDHSGRSVASAGDFNGDGYDDLIIGAEGADGQAGAVYIVFGHAGGFDAVIDLSTLDGATGLEISGFIADDLTGFSVDGAGDVNQDGYDDVLIGAPGAGEGYVVFGFGDPIYPLADTEVVVSDEFPDVKEILGVQEYGSRRDAFDMGYEHVFEVNMSTHQDMMAILLMQELMVAPIADDSGALDADALDFAYEYAENFNGAELF